MALERKILTITTPTLAIEEMSMTNTNPKVSQDAPIVSSENKFNEAGATYPLVQINNYQFGENDIHDFYLDETGFLPRVRVSVTITDGLFISKYFPKDGDPMSIFIRSKTDEFKPVRCDFEITNCNSFPSGDNDGDVQEFTIEGVLKVPNILAEWCVSYSNMTSYDAIQAICNKLQVGFASNEVSTNDKQTWLNGFDTYEKFLNDITNASYKDDNSFYKSYFDHYYYLNLVNMNTQFTDTVNIEDALSTLSINDDFLEGSKMQKISTSLVLINHQSQRSTGNYIKSYTLINKAGQVIIDNGYRRYLQYYDEGVSTTDPETKYQSYFVEPLSTDGTDGKILMRGRPKDKTYGFSTYNKYKYMGTQYGLPDGNCHTNYMHAIVQNHQNIEEIEKMMLRVNLGQCNWNIYRGQIVPVIIFNLGNPKRQSATLDPSQSKDDDISYDKFLTGNYMVHGMTYSWSITDRVWVHECYLTRREWPIPVFAAVIP
jgi:hypothetical protein